MKVANKEMSVRKLWTSNELLDAVSARKAVSIGKLRATPSLWPFSRTST